MTVLPAATIWRDKTVDGVYSSDDHDPNKPDIREWGAWVESGITAGTLNGPWEATKAALDAKLAYGDGNPGFVYDGADFGTYRKSGASGSGSWIKILDTIPGYQFVKAVNAGAGTANAIVATSAPPVAYSDGAQLVRLNIFETNTSGIVTVAFNGEAALTIKTSGGNNPAVGGLVAGMTVLGVVDQSATVFRILSDQASAAVLSGAEDALADLMLRYLGAYVDDAAATVAAGTPSIGQQYFNTTSYIIKVWNGSGWVGASGGVATITRGSDVGDGVETDFTLPASAETTNTHVYIDGRRTVSGFTLSAGALVLSEALGDTVPISWDVYEVSPIGATTASLVSIADVGGHYSGATVEAALQEIGSELTIITSPATPEQFSGTATQKVQAALDAGNPEVRIDGTYACGLLTVPSGVKLLHGRGELTQLASGSNLLTADGVDGLTVSVNLTGLGTSNVTPTSNNDLVYFENCDDLLFESCKISRSLFRPMWLNNGERVRINNVHFFENCIGGARMYNLRTFWVTDCHIDGTCIDPTEFTTGFGCESDSGNTVSGWCRDGTIRGNVIENLGWSQGVLVHSGINISMIRNTVRGCTIGLSANPFSSTDALTYPMFQGNHIECPVSEGAWGTQAGIGINVQAGGSTPNIFSAQATGNTIINANRASGNNNEGGIAWSYVTGGGMRGNDIVAARSNGIVMNAALRVSCIGNTLYDVSSGTTSQEIAISALGGCTGAVHSNLAYDVATLLSTSGSPALSIANNFEA